MPKLLAPEARTYSSDDETLVANRADIERIVAAGLRAGTDNTAAPAELGSVADAVAEDEWEELEAPDELADDRAPALEASPEDTEGDPTSAPEAAAAAQGDGETRPSMPSDVPLWDEIAEPTAEAYPPGLAPRVPFPPAVSPKAPPAAASPSVGTTPLREQAPLLPAIPKRISVADMLADAVDDDEDGGHVSSFTASFSFAPGEQLSFEDERPAAAHLAERAMLPVFATRADWFEREAARLTDPQAKARALLVASELRALAGDVVSARRTALAAQTGSASSPLVTRQQRWLAAAEGDDTAVAAALDLETRASPTHETRVHAALLNVAAQRRKLSDAAGARRKLEIAVRAKPDDPRPHLELLIDDLASSPKAPKRRGQDVPPLLPLAAAIQRVAVMRGQAATDEPLTATLLFEQIRRALSLRDTKTAGSLLMSLARVPGLDRAALTLAAALLAPSSETRPLAIQALECLLAVDPSSKARRALAARALEQGSPSVLTTALAEPASDEDSPTISHSDRIALLSLTGSDVTSHRAAIDALLGDEELWPLAAAALACRDDELPAAALPRSDAAKTSLLLGRCLARLRPDLPALERNAALEATVSAYAQAHPEAPIARMLALELAVDQVQAAAVARSLSEWPPGERGSETAERDRLLLTALIHEIGGDREGAKRDYASAFAVDPRSEIAVRALLDDTAPNQSSLLLAELAEGLDDAARAALLFSEAAIRMGSEDSEAFEKLLGQANDLDPTLPFATRYGEQAARTRADLDTLLRWLRLSRDATQDPRARAVDLVREALLVADSDLDLATSLLREAVKARPEDVALRELEERLRPDDDSERGAWREAAAQRLSDAGRADLLLEAALEYERALEHEKAAQTAAAAAREGGHELAALEADRLAARSSLAAALSERLFAMARDETDARAQRELYARLSALDELRGEASSSLLWHNATLENAPDHLPALRRLEHEYLGTGREEDLEPVAARLSRLLDANEAAGHARLVAHLRAKRVDFSGVVEMTSFALDSDQAPIWALRALSAAAQAVEDDELSLRTDRELSQRTARPAESAALSLRAAEAATRLGKLDEARTLLDRAVELCPQHYVALTTHAEILELVADYTAAAEAWERAASASAIAEHQLSGWHQAGVLWQDRVGDVERAEYALEKATLLDIKHEDAFNRLRSAYVARGESAKLAELLERRLAETTDPDERLGLEVMRGRTLMEIGDAEAAHVALAAALEQNPEHIEALDAFAEVAVANGDHPAAESALVRLARHVADPDKQADIYLRLGELYDATLPNPERAELAYREVLKRRSDDNAIVAKLVAVYGRLNQPAKAIELQTGLLERATSDDAKREQTLALALVHEQIAQDRRTAEATYEKARKQWPHDEVVLRALAEFYDRHGEQRALSMLVDRATNDARRALGTGRFDPAFFRVLALTAELRSAHDSARIVRATVAALEGEESALPGAGLRAADTKLDELLAPELLTGAFRSLLRKTGDALDGAYPIDTKALRAAPLSTDQAAFTDKLQQLAAPFGIQKLEAYASGLVGATCLPASSAPPRVVFGNALFDTDDQAARTFLLVRALKILQLRASAIARTTPIDLWSVLAGYLGLFAPNWSPQGVDAKKSAQAQERIKAAMPRSVDDDVPVLALEVIGSIGNRASQLASAVHQFGNRCALLATGDLTAALRAIALSSGSAPPSDPAERIKWVVRNGEARDLAIFSVSDAYAQARATLGLST
jgi:Tfp pilus assembly protein PilF